MTFHDIFQIKKKQQKELSEMKNEQCVYLDTSNMPSLRDPNIVYFRQEICTVAFFIVLSYEFYNFYSSGKYGHFDQCILLCLIVKPLCSISRIADTK